MPKRNRPYVPLECTSCHHRNYTTSMNPKNGDPLTLNKFCKAEGGVKPHKQSK